MARNGGKLAEYVVAVGTVCWSTEVTSRKQISTVPGMERVIQQ